MVIGLFREFDSLCPGVFEILIKLEGLKLPISED
jgi:hypothetical protein